MTSGTNLLPNACLAAATLQAGHGGIARVARLMSHVLADEAAAGRIRARCVSYLDRDLPRIKLPLTIMRGSKMRFAWQIYKQSFCCSHFLYDFLGMMRAHPRLPLFKRPSLTWIHGMEVWETTNNAYLRGARRADVLISNSAYTRERADRLHNGVGFHRAPLCWLGTVSDELPRMATATDRRPAVLIVGRMEKERYKGHEELIDCWPRVVSAVPDARLLIVGKGSTQPILQQRAASSPSASSIEFKGFVPDEEMENVWNGASVFAMPSRAEGFGLVYIEAMRRGLPVIASVHDAAPEINLEGVTGYNIDMDKPDELPERIIYLLKNPDQSAVLGGNGRSRWQEHFCYSAFKRRFLPLLHPFLSSSRP